MKNCEYLGKGISSPLMLSGRYTPRQWSCVTYDAHNVWNVLPDDIYSATYHLLLRKETESLSFHKSLPTLGILPIVSGAGLPL